MDNACDIEGCGKPPLVRKLCSAHYARLRRYGDPTFSPGPSGVARRPLAERFWPKVDKRGPDDCWLWIGHTKRNGYGAITLGGKSGKIEMAHRAAYMLAHGEIPNDLEIDHRCRTRACVNVAHLQAVTRALNVENRTNKSQSRSGIRNVSWHEPYGKWVVRVTVRRKTHFGGYFSDPEEAGRAAVALRMRLMSNNLADRA